MLLIGLTGSIATGKSTVSSILSQPPYSLPVIDADVLARKVVEPGTAGYKAICAHFLSTTPDLLQPPSSDAEVELNQSPNGKGRPLNRAVLGRRVFGDELERKKDRQTLNGIVHPAVRWEMYKSLVYYYLRGHWAVVLDIPLLFESGLDLLCGTVLVVGVHDPETQMRRLRERDPHLSAEDAANRVKSQSDVREKAARAEMRGRGRGVVVWNDGGREDLEGKVRGVVEELRSGSPQWWAWCLLGLPVVGGVVGGWSVAMGRLERWEWESKEGRKKAKL
ncbi:hypothetical protein MMC09_001242 [Bachmanniomyces sp. S44760]|nr:hypothetical protein [Bachmanniomyces sp. S44760]